MLSVPIGIEQTIKITAMVAVEFQVWALVSIMVLLPQWPLVKSPVRDISS